MVKELETDILEVEATVFSGAVAPTERIYSLRRQATGFYRIVHALLAVVTTVKRTITAPTCCLICATSRTTCFWLTTMWPRSVTCSAPCWRPTWR